MHKREKVYPLAHCRDRRGRRLQTDRRGRRSQTDRRGRRSQTDRRGRRSLQYRIPFRHVSCPLSKDFATKIMEQIYGNIAPMIISFATVKITRSICDIFMKIPFDGSMMNCTQKNSGIGFARSYRCLQRRNTKAKPAIKQEYIKYG